MSWRTIIINSQSKLDVKMGYLVVRGNETRRILLDEVSTLVIENPAVSLTGCLIGALVEKKIKVIFCDSKRNPIAELVPHHGSHDSAIKVRTQIHWSDDIKGVIWREIISEKIRDQAAFLIELDKQEESALLSSYIGQVELLDITNREGHAAKVYFNALFGMNFTRSEENPINAALNYGYSLVLSAFNREVSACGYLTQLGIFHNNMFNHFNLSCDLMEPYRILVDRMVRSAMPEQFETEEKHWMWQIMDQKVKIDGNMQILPNAIRIYTHSVLDAINEKDPSVIKHYEIVK